jgi:hypothetical protein
MGTGERHRAAFQIQPVVKKIQARFNNCTYAILATDPNCDFEFSLEQTYWLWMLHNACKKVQRFGYSVSE